MDNHEMSESWIVEEGRYGPKIVVTGRWSENIQKVMVSEDVKEMELNYAKGWKGDDVSFIQRLPQLEGITLTHRTIDDIQCVNDLHELRYLSVSTYCKTELDFTNWPRLEECSLDEWRPKAASLFKHRGIKTLFVNKWNKGHDLSAFSEMRQLKSLRLYSPSRLEAVAGIEHLTDLTRLELAMAKKLTSLRGLDELARLESLELHTCRKINNISAVRTLHNLREFLLLNCGDIDTIAPLSDLANLEQFLFYESTNVLDGDLSPLQASPRLKSVAFMERPHYSHTRADLPA